MKATKANKVYLINESEKDYYTSQGYDILDDEGEIIKHGAGKSISYEEYKKTLDEIQILKEENEKLKEENKKLKTENKELKKVDK